MQARSVMLLCIECSETFKSRRELQQHQQSAHQFRRADSDSDGEGQADRTEVLEQQQHLQHGTRLHGDDQAGSGNCLHDVPAKLQHAGHAKQAAPVVPRLVTGPGRGSRPGTGSKAPHGERSSEASIQLPANSALSAGATDGIAVGQQGQRGRARSRQSSRTPAVAATGGAGNNAPLPAAASLAEPRQLLRRPQSVSMHDNRSVPGPTVGTVPSHALAAVPQAAALPVQDAAAAATAAILGLLRLRDKSAPGCAQASSPDVQDDSMQKHSRRPASRHGKTSGERRMAQARQQYLQVQEASAGSDAGAAVDQVVVGRQAAAEAVASNRHARTVKAQGRLPRGSNRKAGSAAVRASAGNAWPADGDMAAAAASAATASAADGKAEVRAASAKPKSAARGRSKTDQDAASTVVVQAPPLELSTEAVAKAVANALAPPGTFLPQPRASVAEATAAAAAQGAKQSRGTSERSRQAAEIRNVPGRSGSSAEQAAGIEGSGNRAAAQADTTTPRHSDTAMPLSAAEADKKQLKQQRGRRSAAAVSFFSCPTCASNFYSPVVLRHHMRTEHPGVVLADAQVKRSSLPASPVPGVRMQPAETAKPETSEASSGNGGAPP